MAIGDSKNDLHFDSKSESAHVDTNLKTVATHFLEISYRIQIHRLCNIGVMYDRYIN